MACQPAGPPGPYNRAGMTTVLVVDDEKDILELVRYHVEKAGLQCLTVADGAGALRLVRERRPDLVVLDLMLPGLDGIEVCRQLRRDPATARLPVIMLTARAEEVDRVVGLEVGADDYVVKPFSPRELVARIHAILRRADAPAATVIRLGALTVDEPRHQATVDGASLELTAKEFALLVALLRAGGRVLSREQLLDTVWGYANAAEIESRTVDVHIRRLREKLGAEARRVVTVKGVGYRVDVEAEA
jgi:DNA-binding response OmpR family regulator